VYAVTRTSEGRKTPSESAKLRGQVWAFSSSRTRLVSKSICPSIACRMPTTRYITVAAMAWPTLTTGSQARCGRNRRVDGYWREYMYPQFFGFDKFVRCAPTRISCNSVTNTWGPIQAARRPPRPIEGRVADRAAAGSARRCWLEEALANRRPVSVSAGSTSRRFPPPS